MVRCIACANSPTFVTGMWTTPTVIVPNEAQEFNQATQPFTTPSGRVIVVWNTRVFGPPPAFDEIENRIEYAYSDDDGVTFTPEKLIAIVNPQGEPPGYNRARPTILNAPYVFVDQAIDDGVDMTWEKHRAGFGNIYVAYFSGKTPLPQVIPMGCTSQAACNPFARAADIFVSRSTNNGASFQPKVKVNDDTTNTVHVFPSVQVNLLGQVFASWIDRRRDPAPFVPGTTPGGGNILNDTWAALSHNRGMSFGRNVIQSDVQTSWFTRADARPNFGDYNSSEMKLFLTFVTTWADGRFPPGTFEDIRPPATTGPTRLAATPDSIFTDARFDRGHDDDD
jgi:hypothetical protein